MRGLGADDIVINDDLIKVPVDIGNSLISSRLWLLLFEPACVPRLQSFLSSYGYIEANSRGLKDMVAEFLDLRGHSFALETGLHVPWFYNYAGQIEIVLDHFLDYTRGLMRLKQVAFPVF